MAKGEAKGFLVLIGYLVWGKSSEKLLNYFSLDHVKNERTKSKNGRFWYALFLLNRLRILQIIDILHSLTSTNFILGGPKPLNQLKREC